MRSTPIEDSAITNPKNMSKARKALPAILRTDKSDTAGAIRARSAKVDSHKVTISTKPV